MEPFFFFDSSSSPHNPSDVEALRRLSDSLLLLRLSPSDSFSDLTIAVRSSDPPRDLAVHRCILSARSPFFRRLLPGTTERLDLGEILPCFDVGFDALVLVVGYLYSGKVGPLPRGVCECADEDCRHVACRPAVEFMAHVLFAASGFEISELVSLFQSMENAEENKGTGHVMDENTCSLCWMKNLRFELPAKYCACCSKKINPKGLYYLIVSSESGSDGQSLLCAECQNTRPKVDGKCIPKENLQRRENYAETEDLYERWVQCGKCDSRQHGICALINFSRNESQTCYTCPTCFLQERESGEHATLPRSMAFGAEDLPTTMLSDHIEQRLFRRLKEDRQERASSLGKNFYEVPAAEGLVVRVVSSFVKKVEVKQNFRDIFQKEKYPSEFPYKSKAILLFQKIDGADVLLFAMYVQEYGSECAFPNRRQVCISYIDSVRYFKPEIPAASGEALRMFVYHEILIGYHDYSKKRGFNSCYIWVCPPSKGDDYILHCHPNLQKIPKPDKLRGWYQNLFRKAIKEEIVAECTKFYDQFFIQSKKMQGQAQCSSHAIL